MDKCREEFEKWLDDNNMFMNIERRFDQESNTYDYCAIRWIWESWQHQQAKVEELQKQVGKLSRDSKSYKIQRDEYAHKLTKLSVDFERFKSGVSNLKDRMENALAVIQHTKFSWSKIKKIEQALKGEG